MILKNLPPFFIVLLCSLLAQPIYAGAPPQGPDAVSARMDDDGVQRASLVGGSYFFNPNHLVVKVNLPVELSLSREAGIVPHTLRIMAPEAGILLDQTLGTTVSKVRFTPTSTGMFRYYCGNKLLFFKSHQEQGMEGMLEVVP